MPTESIADIDIEQPDSWAIDIQPIFSLALQEKSDWAAIMPFSSLFIPNLHDRLPVLPSQPNFGTVQEIQESGQILPEELRVKLDQATAVIPFYSFSQLTPDELVAVSKNLELFMDPERFKDNFPAVYDYVISLQRSKRIDISSETWKKLKLINEKRLFWQEEFNFAINTLKHVLVAIISNGEWFSHLLERNIGTNIPETGDFIKEIENLFQINSSVAWNSTAFKELSEKRWHAIRQLLCFIRILDQTQLIYAKRLAIIVPYYQKVTKELLKFYAELLIKCEQQWRQMTDFFDTDEIKEIQSNLDFIRGIDGNMAGFGRISPAQEWPLKASMFSVTQRLQTAIDFHEEFSQLVSDDCIREKWNIDAAYREIMIRLYDRTGSRRWANIAKSGASRYPEIDDFVKKVLWNKDKDFMYWWIDAVTLCLRDKPDLIQVAPDSLKEILIQYV